jgi:hypothetical protein
MLFCSTSEFTGNGYQISLFTCEILQMAGMISVTRPSFNKPLEVMNKEWDKHSFHHIVDRKVIMDRLFQWTNRTSRWNARRGVVLTRMKRILRIPENNNGTYRRFFVTMLNIDKCGKRNFRAEWPGIPQWFILILFRSTSYRSSCQIRYCAKTLWFVILPKWIPGSG